MTRDVTPEFLRDLAAEARRYSWGNPDYLRACDALERGEIVPPIEMLAPLLVGDLESETVSTVSRLCAKWVVRENRIREAQATEH